MWRTQIKNVFDASIGAIVWWLWGYGIALGRDTYASTGNNGFWGQSYYSAENTNGYGDAMWLFQWAFAGATATIVSGAVAERVSFSAYIIYSVFLTGFICALADDTWLWPARGGERVTAARARGRASRQDDV